MIGTLRGCGYVGVVLVLVLWGRVLVGGLVLGDLVVTDDLVSWWFGGFVGVSVILGGCDVGIVLLFAFACGFSGYCGRHSLGVLFVTANLVPWLVGGLL